MDVVDSRAERAGNKSLESKAELFMCFAINNLLIGQSAVNWNTRHGDSNNEEGI